MSTVARAARTVLIAGLTVGVVALAAGGTGFAGSADAEDAEAEDLLERARSVSTDFAGYVEVRWQDETGDQVARLGARSLRGAFVVGSGAEKVQGEGLKRWGGAGGGPEVAWQTVDSLAAPGAGTVWDLEIAGTDTVAGREATIVEASDDDGDVRARFAIDAETGQLLHREVLDDDGDVARSVGFVRLTPDPAAPAVPAPPAAAGPGPVPIEDVPGGFVAPARLAGGYQLLGRYQHPDGAVQLFYGDGLFAVSVFQQQGRVDWSGLPTGGREATEDGLRTHSYATASGDVIVWSDGGLVLTAVADGPPGAARAVVADLAGLELDRSTLEEIADFILGPFGWE
jgi:hypothetical protein